MNQIKKLEEWIADAPEHPTITITTDLDREAACKAWDDAVAERHQDRLREKGFPERHIRNLAAMHGPGLERAKELEARVRSGNCLMILCGDRGPGKTQIATYWGLLFQFPRYYKAHGLISTIRGQFSDDPDIRAEASKTLNSAKVCQYLVIDEFSELAGSDYEKRELTHLIDCRYDALKTTVIVTNQPKDKIGQEVGRSIVSRASEVGGVVHCDWPSYRAPA